MRGAADGFPYYCLPCLFLTLLANGNSLRKFSKCENLKVIACGGDGTVVRGPWRRWICVRPNLRFSALTPHISMWHSSIIAYHCLSNDILWCMYALLGLVTLLDRQDQIYFPSCSTSFTPLPLGSYSYMTKSRPIYIIF